MKNILEAIANLVCQSDAEVQNRLREQQQELRQHRCTQPKLGHWVLNHDVNYLLSTLELSEQEFRTRFPKSRVSVHYRRKLVGDLEKHFQQCIHCSLKRGYDMELDARIEQACKQHANVLLGFMTEDAGEIGEEGEHIGFGLTPQFASH